MNMMEKNGSESELRLHDVAAVWSCNVATPLLTCTKVLVLWCVCVCVCVCVSSVCECVCACSEQRQERPLLAAPGEPGSSSRSSSSGQACYTH